MAKKNNVRKTLKAVAKFQNAQAKTNNMNFVTVLEKIQEALPAIVTLFLPQKENAKMMSHEKNEPLNDKPLNDEGFNDKALCDALIKKHFIPKGETLLCSGNHLDLILQEDVLHFASKIFPYTYSVRLGMIQLTDAFRLKSCIDFVKNA